MASRKQCTSAQLALAWLLAKGDDMVPIPGTKHVKYVEENVGAADITLTKAEIDGLEATFRADAAAGDRYNEAMGRLVDRSS
jgi:aryl-alcohol dehydrogenase-like predicted oxidoreductase